LDHVNAVADRLALALDPVRLARRVGFEPDPWQAELLRSDARQTILNCSRQSGKSTTTALVAVHESEARPGSLILLLSPSLRQSQELFRKIRDVRAALAGDACAADRQGGHTTESSLRLELANRSRILALPGTEKTIRGYSGVRLLIVDEASRVADALYEAVRPMLAVSGGRLILLSTPFGQRGFFHREWTEGGPDWHRAMVTAHDCPRIPPEWLEAERERIGSWSFRQEFLCEFVAAVDSVFGLPLLKGAIDDDVKPLFGDWRASDA